MFVKATAIGRWLFNFAMTEEEARRKAGADLAVSIASEAFAGVLSGGIGGGMQGVYQGFKNKRAGDDINYRGNTKELINKGLTAPIGSRTYENAVDAAEKFRENEKAPSEEGADEGSFAIGRTDAGNPVVVLTENVFEGKTGKPHEVIADLIAEQEGNAYKIAQSGRSVYIGEDLPGEYTQSKYTQWLLAHKRKYLKIKNQSVQNFEEIIEIADNRRWEKNSKSKHAVDAKYGFYKYDSKVAHPIYDAQKNVTGYKTYDVELVIRNDADGKSYLYDIQNIKESNDNYSPPANTGQNRHISLLSSNSIAPKGDAVNTQYMQEGGEYSGEQNESPRQPEADIPPLGISARNREGDFSKPNGNFAEGQNLPKGKGGLSGEYSVHNRNNNSVKSMEVGNLYNSMLQEGYITPEEGERYRGVSLRVRQSGEAVGANEVQIAEAEIEQHIQRFDMV